MDILQFNLKMKEFNAKTDKFINSVAPLIANNIAVEKFKHNFDTESFFGKKWQEVQRRISTSKSYLYNSRHHPSRNNRKILTGDTGDLGRSISSRFSPAQTVIYSDKVYSAVHNEGLQAGRGSGFIMPQRQFIGESEELIKDIEQALSDYFDKMI